RATSFGGAVKSSTSSTKCAVSLMRTPLSGQPQPRRCRRYVVAWSLWEPRGAGASMVGRGLGSDSPGRVGREARRRARGHRPRQTPRSLPRSIAMMTGPSRVLIRRPGAIRWSRSSWLSPRYPGLLIQKYNSEHSEWYVLWACRPLEIGVVWPGEPESLVEAATLLSTTSVRACCQLMEEYDYVVVGGGSAGCVVAARLSENRSLMVCLLEAGPSDL